MTKSDEINIAIAVGMTLIAITIAVVNMWWSSYLTNKTIQATLQSAQPALIPPPKATKAKRLGPKQRHAIKVLRMMQRVIVVSLFAIVLELPMSLLMFPLSRLTIILFAISSLASALAVYGGIRAVMETRKVIRAVEAGNRRVINGLYKSLIKSPPT